MRHSFQAQIQEDSLNLPYTQFLLRLFFSKNKDVKVVQDGPQSADDIIFTESDDGKKLFYCAKNSISQDVHHKIASLIPKVISIAARCPESLIAKFDLIPG